MSVIRRRRVELRPPTSELIAKIAALPPRRVQPRGDFFDELHLPARAEILRARRATLSDLVNCKAALSPEMALRIEKASIPMDILLCMPAWHDGPAMRQCVVDKKRPFR